MPPEGKWHFGCLTIIMRTPPLHDSELDVFQSRNRGTRNAIDPLAPARRQILVDVRCENPNRATLCTNTMASQLASADQVVNQRRADIKNGSGFPHREHLRNGWVWPFKDRYVW